MIDMRTVLICRACAARSHETGVLPRVLVDADHAVTFTLLGCPVCSGELTVERVEGLSVAPPPSAADVTRRGAAIGSTIPAPRSSPPAASPSTRPPNGDFVQMPSRAKCAKCDASFTFPVSEPMTEAIKRVGWRVAAAGGVVCPKHADAA
jgi:hypothetical protein